MGLIIPSYNDIYQTVKEQFVGVLSSVVEKGDNELDICQLVENEEEEEMNELKCTMKNKVVE